MSAMEIEAEPWSDSIADCEEDLAIMAEEIAEMKDQLRLASEGKVQREGDWFWRCTAALRHKRKDHASLKVHLTELRRQEAARREAANRAEKAATAARQREIEAAAQKARAERIAANNNSAVREHQVTIRILRAYIKDHLGEDHLEAATERCDLAREEIRAAVREVSP